MNNWEIYLGEGNQHQDISLLPPPPEWRIFDPTGYRVPWANHEVQWSPSDEVRGRSYRADPESLTAVNAAIYLRRPLLVTGTPGVGKSTLAYSIAWELGLGPVLRWPITSGSTLRDGLYRYDAIGRLQDVNLNDPSHRQPISKYLRLGPLGTAFQPIDTPRVLLIDEIDKASLDLPSDLLSIFEEGRYEIDELVRIAKAEPRHLIRGADGADVPILAGEVRCRQFPIVIMTSNGEREFPPAFLRRCVRLNIDSPNEVQLKRMIDAQMGPEMRVRAGMIIRRYQERAAEGLLANDQLLNAIHLTCRIDMDPDDQSELMELLFQSLDAELA